MMKSIDRHYGVPFFKITIPFINNYGERIGSISIRSVSATPIEFKGTQAVFKDIDDAIYYCDKGSWKNHGPAQEEELFAPYG